MPVDPTALSAAAAGTVAIGDFTVHRMGFGAMRLTGPGVWGPPRNRAEALRVLRRAVDLGIDFIDTANSYGPGVSEELIAEALHPYPAGLVIATKGGLERPGPDQWISNGRPDHLRRELEGSLRRLRVDRIDLYQLHRIDPQVPEAEQLDTLREFQREGLVRHLGLSEASIEQIERVRRVVPVVSVQNRYNLHERRWDGVVDYCERERLAFLPWYPLAAGAVRDTDALDRIARAHDATRFQVALAWLLARSPAMLVIPGTSSVAHLEENVAAAALRLTPEEITALSE